MRPTSFIAVLFVMAASCVVIALSDRSWGWLIGGIVFLALGVYARRQHIREQDPDFDPGLGVGRFAFVFIILAVGIYGIYWLANAG